jgi:hypothetical protein
MIPNFHDIRHMKVVRLSASRTGRLYRNVPGTHFHYELSRRQCHGAVGRNMSLKNPVTPPGIDPGTVRLVAQRLNHYTTQGPYGCSSHNNYSTRRALNLLAPNDPYSGRTA